HIIVCCAAALLMLVSKYGFADLTLPDGASFSGTRGADPARVAAQVVSGISVLGAGVIFKTGSTVKGLTTAAGVWATAGIGLAIGSGMYILGLFTTLILVLLQFAMHRFTIGADSFTINILTFTVRDTADLYLLLRPFLQSWDAQIQESSVKRTGAGLLQYELTMRTPHSIHASEIDRFVRENPEVLSGNNQAIR
ncbi:MAG: MgtC/SapB family protein, partial [Oscillospiraceae bacterium]|nr:MgtC/SapB family protein [Oscillospiraceae bacterium]